MLRRRVIAAAPARPASSAWAVIADLVANTLEKSPSISRSSVVEALGSIKEAGAALVAGGHLEGEPLVLVAPPVHLEITVVSGEESLRLEENLSPVPGGAGASKWTLHVPAPEPLSDWIRDATASEDRLTTEPPPSPEADNGKRAGNLVDLAALSRLKAGGA